ncbi:MAG TPA: phosphatase PAP2 family protein [Chthoniobacterales bacterium]|jgi:undecaprenyl-diphosphatase|nr:phosphatase PAP2 family protein [Chthoniobacterales bacterium]
MSAPAPRRFHRPRRFLAARLSPEGYLGLHLTIGLVVVAGAGWWFGNIAEHVTRDPATRLLDQSITAWFQAQAKPLFTTIMLAITFFGSVIFLSCASAVLAAVLVIRSNFYRLLAVALATGGGAVLNLLLKQFFHRDRPALENPIVMLASYGFPSGHTMGATLFYGVLALAITYSVRSWGLRILIGSAAFVVVALVGISRIYLGAHYFTDVTGAIAIGLAWLAFSWTGMETLRRRRKYRQEARS